MNTTQVPKNGTAPDTNHTSDVLAFGEVDHNSYRRTSINATWTCQRTSGKSDVAIRLTEDLIDDLQQRRSKEAIDFDALDVRAIRGLVQQRLEGISELTEPVDQDLGRAQQLLRDLAAQKPTKVARQVQEIATAAAANAIAPIRSALRANACDAPYAFAERLDDLERLLRDLPLPAPDFSSHRRFNNAVRGLDGISAIYSFSPKLRETILLSLRKRCHVEFETALGAVVEEYVTTALRQAIVEILPYLDELRTNQVTFHRHIDSIREQLMGEQIQARKRAIQSLSSIVVELETPDQDQILAGMRDRHRCQDRKELAQRYTADLTAFLNEVARARHPHISVPATLAELVTQLPPRETAVAIGEVVARLIGDVHTVYTAIRGAGVERIARELFDRSSPLCQLDSRDHIRLNVETHRDLIVRLPLPRGADDAAIAEQLREAFRELQPACQFLDDPIATEITVVRTLVGFPIGIEATNVFMVIEYGESAAQGHFPHLFGLLPEAPEGTHIPRLLALARHHLKH
jgi:hypothetical protein